MSKPLPTPGTKNLQTSQLLLVDGLEFRFWPFDITFKNPVFNDCFVGYDTVNNVTVALSTSNWNNFLGLAIMSAPVPGLSGYSGTLGVTSVPPNAITLGQITLSGGILVCTRGLAVAYATAADNYSPGTKLYLGVDARTVTSTIPQAGAPSIGTVAGQQAVVTNAVAGSTVLIDFKANWPTPA